MACQADSHPLRLRLGVHRSQIYILDEKARHSDGSIQPSKPQQDACIQRANRTIQHSWVSKYPFDSLEEVQDYATQWLWFYNHERPHKTNGGRPPLMAA